MCGMCRAASECQHGDRWAISFLVANISYTLSPPSAQLICHPSPSGTGTVDAATGTRFVSGGVLRVLRCWPGAYEAHAMAADGSSQLLEASPGEPSYKVGVEGGWVLLKQVGGSGGVEAVGLDGCSSQLLEASPGEPSYNNVGVEWRILLWGGCGGVGVWSGARPGGGP